MAGMKNQIAGKAHQITGRITDDKTEQIAGNVQQEKGKLQSKAARAKAKIVAGTEAIVDKALG